MPEPRNHPTERLIAYAREGDRSATNELIERFRGRLARFVGSRLGPGLEQIIDAEDVTQETLLRALDSLELFSWRGEESFLRWLNRIAVNVICDVARREKKGLIVPLTSDVAGVDPSPSRTMRRRERLDRLNGAFAALSEDQRRVILFARIDRLPIKEVARRMDRSPEATTQLLWRALKRLKVLFGKTDSLGLPFVGLQSGSELHGE